MAGHSRWTQIKRKKGIKDQARGQIFTKISKTITLAVIDDRGIKDPEKNVKLRLAIEKAKQVNMPKENIQRAIERGSGPAKDNLSQVVYEGFGPGGISFIILVTTDNPNRTLPELRGIFDRHSGKLGAQGSAAHLFTKAFEDGKTDPDLIGVDYKPQMFIKIEDKIITKEILSLTEALENHDDVQRVFSNFDMPENLLNL